MPLPAALTRLNRRVTNPVLGRLAGRVAPLATVTNRGRRSGRTYVTPVFAFGGPDVITIALTYGSGVDWLANARAAGGCVLRHRGRTWRLGEPHMLDASVGRERMPALIRAVLASARVTEFVEFPVLGQPLP